MTDSVAVGRELVVVQVELEKTHAARELLEDRAGRARVGIVRCGKDGLVVASAARVKGGGDGDFACSAAIEPWRRGGVLTTRQRCAGDQSQEIALQSFAAYNESRADSLTMDDRALRLVRN